MSGITPDERESAYNSISRIRSWINGPYAGNRTEVFREDIQTLLALSLSALREHPSEQPSQPITAEVTYVGAATRDGVLHLFESEERFREFTNCRRVSWMGWIVDVVFHPIQTKASEKGGGE